MEQQINQGFYIELLLYTQSSSWPTSSAPHGKFKPATVKIENFPWSSHKRNSPHHGSAPYCKFKPTIVKIGYVPWSSQNMKSQFTGKTWCTFLKTWDRMSSSSFNSLSLEGQSQQTKKPCQKFENHSLSSSHGVCTLEPLKLLFQGKCSIIQLVSTNTLMPQKYSKGIQLKLKFKNLQALTHHLLLFFISSPIPLHNLIYNTTTIALTISATNIMHRYLSSKFIDTKLSMKMLIIHQKHFNFYVTDLSHHGIAMSIMMHLQNI